MPRLNAFKIKIETGERGRAEPPKFKINGHAMVLEKQGGDGVGPGQTFEGGFAPRSFAHSLVLEGPPSGAWDIRRVEMTYDCDGDEPYRAVFAPVTLDETTDLNIWQEKPLPTFDV